MTVIAVLGLGEAGSAFVADLLTAGVTVRAYDPAVGAPPGTVACASEAEAVAEADLVLSVNSADDSVEAARNALSRFPATAVWADVNSSSPERKREVAAVLDGRGRFADVALMSTVPGQGIRVPMAAAGPGAAEAARLLGAAGASVELIEGEVGDAAARKLLRSVFYKGLAAAVLESLAAARAAGLEEETRAEIRRELDRASAATLDRLVEGSHRHAVRRSHEMAAAAEMLTDLGVPPRVAEASRDWLTDLADLAEQD